MHTHTPTQSILCRSFCSFFITFYVEEKSETISYMWRITWTRMYTLFKMSSIIFVEISLTVKTILHKSSCMHIPIRCNDFFISSFSFVFYTNIKGNSLVDKIVHISCHCNWKDGSQNIFLFLFISSLSWAFI